MLVLTYMADGARTSLRRQPGSERIGTVAVAPEDWSQICLKDAHPAYVDWDEFMANRRQLVDNLNRYDKPGRPRGHRAKAMHCCRGSSAVAAAPAACACATRDRRATIRFTSVLPTVALKGGRSARRRERSRSMLKLSG